MTGPPVACGGWTRQISADATPRPQPRPPRPLPPPCPRPRRRPPRAALPLLLACLHRRQCPLDTRTGPIASLAPSGSHLPLPLFAPAFASGIPIVTNHSHWSDNRMHGLLQSVWTNRGSDCEVGSVHGVELKQSVRFGFLYGGNPIRRRCGKSLWQVGCLLAMEAVQVGSSPTAGFASDGFLARKSAHVAPKIGPCTAPCSAWRPQSSEPRGFAWRPVADNGIAKVVKFSRHVTTRVALMRGLGGMLKEGYVLRKHEILDEHTPVQSTGDVIEKLKNGFKNFKKNEYKWVVFPSRCGTLLVYTIGYHFQLLIALAFLNYQFIRACVARPWSQPWMRLPSLVLELTFVKTI